MQKRVLACVIVSLALISCREPQLMPYSEFAKMDELGLPRILHLKSDSKELLYIGTYHSNNQEDSIFLIINQYLDEFNPDFVFHEGSSNWPIYADPDSTILFSGEPGFLIQAAQNRGIPYQSIEPKAKDEYGFLLESFDFDWVVLMYLCRQIDQQQRFAEQYNTSDEDFRNNMNHFLNSLNQEGLILNSTQKDFSYWQSKYSELMQKDLNWRSFEPKEYYPNFSISPMNEVNRQSDFFRNKTMVDNIFNALEDHNRVLVLVGGGHLIIQEELINHRFKSRY